MPSCADLPKLLLRVVVYAVRWWLAGCVLCCVVQMPPDWLFQTICHLERDKQLAFVQTRWSFTNGYDNLLCW